MSCNHEWAVFSTALGERWLMLQCVKCGQHDGLGPVAVDHINGPDGVLMNFMPTRTELMTLARDYLNRIRELECWQATGNSGSFEIRETAFCWRRFESISEAISPGKLLPEFQEFLDKLKVEIDEILEDTKERNRIEEEEARSQGEGRST